jgi:Putative prokaryotic signal transducing protein
MMDPENLVSVCTVNNPTEAEIIRGSLESVGIACQIGGESQAGLAGVLEIQILTHESDAVEARKYLDTLRQEKMERKKKRVAARRAKEASADTSEAIQENPPGNELPKE